MPSSLSSAKRTNDPEVSEELEERQNPVRQRSALSTHGSKQRSRCGLLKALLCRSGQHRLLHDAPHGRVRFRDLGGVRVAEARLERLEEGAADDGVVDRLDLVGALHS